MKRLSEAVDLERVLGRLSALRERAREQAQAEGYLCFVCQDTGYRQPHGALAGDLCGCDAGRILRRREQDRLRARWQGAALDDALEIPKRLQRYTLDSFPNPGSPTLRAVRHWRSTTERPPGLFLTGGVGRGKSALAAALLRTLAEEQGAATEYRGQPGDYGAFVVMTGLMDRLRSFRDGLADETLERMSTLPLVVFDDFGADRLTDWGADRVFEIVNARHNAGLPMLITSNLNHVQITDRIDSSAGAPYGQRIVGRIVESCAWIAFNDAEPDWRMQRG